jgi:hypothetical protein
MIRALLVALLAAAPASAQTCITETFAACEGSWCGWDTTFESDHSALRSRPGKGEISSVTYGPFQGVQYQHGVEVEWTAAGGGHTSLRAEFVETGVAGEAPHYWTLLYSAPVCPPEDPSYPNCRGTCTVGPPPVQSDSLRGFFIGNVGVVVGSLAAIGVQSPIEFPPQPTVSLAIAVRSDDRSLRIISPVLMYPLIEFGEKVEVELVAVDNGDGTHDVNASATYGGKTRSAVAVVQGVDLSGPARVASYTASPSACTTAEKYPFGAGRTGKVTALEVCQAGGGSR